MIDRPRDFWKFASRTGGWRQKGASAGLQPLYDGNGNLLTDLQDIVQRWADHYEFLGSDITGHSRDYEYWEEMDCAETQQPHLTELDKDLSVDELWDTLHLMKRHKAPGKDGIPSDFLQGCLEEETLVQRAQELRDRGETVVIPSFPMSSCLLQLLNKAFSIPSIPSNWKESVVVSIPKDGDLADPGNYRGISLMSCTLKVLMVALSQRINSALEERQLFHPSQAGFRKLEEAVTQAACVLEILQRRKIAGDTTYAVFVDLQKAYDTVTHGALFAKLSQIGIQGRCLEFLKRLYDQSTICVRVGGGPDAQYSRSFPLQRGVRQG